MWDLHFIAQYPIQNQTRNSCSLKIRDFKNFCMILKKGKRGCSLKAGCKNTVYCNYCWALALNDDEDLFPLFWISVLTVPMRLIFIIWFYRDSCPESPNWFLETEIARSIPSVSCSQLLMCCNRLTASQTGPLQKMSQPPCHHHWLWQRMCVWMSRSFHLWSF